MISEIFMDRADRDDFRRALARAVDTQPAAEEILSLIDFPRERLPRGAGLNWEQWWTEVFDELDRGIVDAPYRRLLETALGLYELNKTFSSLAQRYGLGAVRGAVAAPAGESAPRWHFFLSYTAADRAWAEWIAWQPEDAGYRVLFQAWDFVPGSHWTTRMREGITGAEHTLAILSRAYLNSVFGQAEWQAACRADPQGFARKLIPVRVEGCDRPDILGEVVSFDLFDLTAEAARRHLLDAVGHARAGRAKPETEPAFPTPRPPSARPAAEPAFPGPRGRTAPDRTAARPRRVRRLAPGSASVNPRLLLPAVAVAVAAVAILVTLLVIYSPESADGSSRQDQSAGPGVTAGPMISTQPSALPTGAAGCGQTGAPPSSARGSITWPADGSVLRDVRLTAAGTTGALEAGHEYRLFLLMEPYGRYYPGEGVTPTAQSSWEGELYLGEPEVHGRSFRVCLVDLGPRDLAYLNSYWERQYREGGVAGIPPGDLMEMTAVASVSVRRE